MPVESMSEQLSLTGFAPPPKRTDRLFFALFPDEATASRVADLSRQQRDANGFHRQPLRTDRFHVTLHHLGDFAGLPAGIVAKAKEAAERVVHAPFQVEFDRVASFKGTSGNNPLVLKGGPGVEAVIAFQQALGEAMLRGGLRREVQSGYTPHMTLVYGDHVAAEQDVEPVGWTAHEFVLVHSLIGQTVHIPLARWPLRA